MFIDEAQSIESFQNMQIIYKLTFNKNRNKIKYSNTQNLK